MNVEHTPGPWTRGNAHNAGKGYAICQDGCVIARVSGRGYPISIGYHPQSEADANLISAAPDLLAALRTMVNEAAIAGDYTGQSKVVRAGMLAIAKAEGRA